METVSITAEIDHAGRLRAFINTHIFYDNEDIRCAIKDPRGVQPFYFLDGARHDLKPHEIKALRKAIREVT